MADNLGKKPKKGILKNSSSFERCDLPQGSKEMKWDEMNIIATHHPADKDYGHMKIDEPKTPYNYYSDSETTNNENNIVDPNMLAEKITLGGTKPPKYLEPVDDSSEEEIETEEERAKRKLFEQKRKLHYNEFQAVKLAKKLMEDDDDDEEDEEGEDSLSHNIKDKDDKSTKDSKKNKSP